MLVSYATMKPAGMGLNAFVIEDDNKALSVKLELASSARPGESPSVDVAVDLRQYFIGTRTFRRNAIVCHGTTCYHTSDGRVAKFAWTSDKRPLEFTYLQLAKEKGVKGIATAEAWKQITTINEVRAGLFSPGPLYYRSSGGHTTSTARLNIKKRSYNEAKNLTLQDSDCKWENGILTCLAICPAGRVLSEIQTVEEVIETELDAIRDHRSLFMQANVLHRDISPNNIIITEPGEKNPDGFRGMLIDLDVAKRQGDKLSGAAHLAGTLPFMSIAVLKGEPHFCRDDLESFLYCLVLLFGRQAWWNVLKMAPVLSSPSVLAAWCGKEPAKTLAKTKFELMNSQKAFAQMMDNEFPKQMPNVEAAKGLHEKVRLMLFTGYIDETSRPTDPTLSYDSIIEAFGETLQELRKASSVVSRIGRTFADVGQGTELRHF